jgi:hypothetical protein
VTSSSASTGEEADSTDELVGLVKKHHAATRSRSPIVRDGQPQKIKVKLATRSSANLGAGAGALAAPVEVEAGTEGRGVRGAALREGARARREAGRPRRGRQRPAAIPRCAGKSMRCARARPHAQVDGRAQGALRVAAEDDREDPPRARRQRRARLVLVRRDDRGPRGHSGHRGKPPLRYRPPSGTGLPSELATPGVAAVAVPDGGAFQIEAAQDGKPVILHLEGSDQKIELQGLGPQIQAIARKHEGDGAVLRVKPKVDGNVIELEVVTEEGGGCCTVGACEDEKLENQTIVVHGMPGKSVQNIQVVPMGGATAMAPGMGGVVVHGQGAPANGGGLLLLLPAAGGLPRRSRRAAPGRHGRTTGHGNGRTPGHGRGRVTRAWA